MMVTKLKSQLTRVREFLIKKLQSQGKGICDASSAQKKALRVLVVALAVAEEKDEVFRNKMAVRIATEEAAKALLSMNRSA